MYVYWVHVVITAYYYRMLRLSEINGQLEFNISLCLLLFSRKISMYVIIYEQFVYILALVYILSVSCALFSRM